MKPRDAEGWNEVGVTHMQMGHYLIAELAYEMAIRLEPNNAKYLNGFAASQHMQGKDAEAEALFRKAAELEPAYSRYWFHLATVQFNQSKYSDAIISYKKAIKLEPDNSMYWNNFGTALDKQGTIAGAGISYSHAIALKPDNAAAWNNLGNLKYLQNKYPEAESSYTKATDIDPTVSMYWINLGIVQCRQNKRNDAEISCTKAILLNPTEISYWNWLYINNGTSKEDGSVVEFIKTLDKDQKHASNALKNLKLRVATHQHTEEDFSYLKAEASYYIVNTFHKQFIDQAELDSYRKKIDAPSRNIGSPNADHDAIKYYYSESIKSGQVLSDVYDVTKLPIKKSTCLFSRQSLKLTCLKVMIDNGVDLKKAGLNEEFIQSAAAEIRALKF